MCFGVAWLENFIIWLIIICAVVALLRLLVSFVLPKMGLGADVFSVVVRAITIVIWAIVCVGVVVFVFDLIACLLGGGLGLPRIR